MRLHRTTPLGHGSGTPPGAAADAQAAELVKLHYFAGPASDVQVGRWDAIDGKELALYRGHQATLNARGS